MSVNDITSADLSMFDTGYRMLGAGARGRSREMISGGRWEEGSGLGTHIHPWWIHVNVWQNQYSIVKQNKVKKKKIHLQCSGLTLVRFLSWKICWRNYKLTTPVFGLP